MTRRAERPLTKQQIDILGVVDQVGPVIPGDIEYHLRVPRSSAQSALAALERRGLVGATYTGHHRGSGRAYETTRRGTELVETLLADDEDAES